MTPPAPTERGEETRLRIIDAARRLFVDHGFEATSVSRIINTCGITKGGFYFHFASKDELAADVMDAIAAAQHVEIMAAVGSHERAIDQLAALARAAAATHATPSSAALCRLGFELSHDSDGPPPNCFGDWFVAVQDLLRRAQAQGDMDPKIDPVDAAQYIVTAFIGQEHMAELMRTPPDEFARSMESYLAFTFRACGITAAVPSYAPTPGGAR